MKKLLSVLLAVLLTTLAAAPAYANQSGSGLCQHEKTESCLVWRQYICADEEEHHYFYTRATFCQTCGAELRRSTMTRTEKHTHRLPLGQDARPTCLCGHVDAPPAGWGVEELWAVQLPRADQA